MIRLGSDPFLATRGVRRILPAVGAIAVFLAPVTTVNAAREPETTEAWRGRLLRILLLATVVPGLLALWRASRDLPQILVPFLVLGALSLAAAIPRRLPTWLRAAPLLATLFAGGVAGVRYIGFEAGAGVALASFVLMTTVLFGMRWGIAALATAGGLVGFAAHAHGSGIWVVADPALRDWSTGRNWVRVLLVWAVMTGVATLLVSLLLRRLEQGLRRTGALVADLEAQIAARDALQQRLNQAQKLETVGLLAAGLAHEFNNTLTVVLTGSAWIRNDDSASRESHEFAEDIERAALRASQLTRGLLTFTRSGLAPVVALEPNAIVREVVRMLQRLLPARIRVREELAEGLPRVRADAASMQQMLMNLAVNARDAMPDGGTLTMRTEMTTGCREATPGGPCVVFTVTDTGTGMDAATRARIFEPLFTTKEPGRGTGLGLPIVAEIVARLGGQIEVDSEVGRGTTFRIQVPAIAEPVDEHTPVPERPRARDGERVLVVDDDPLVRRSIAQTLRDAGYAVEAAEDAVGAERVAREAASARREFALLLSDVVMPNSDVRALVREFRTQHPRGAVLLCSGYAEEPALREMVERGDLPMLSKPFVPEELLRRVREVLGR